MQQHDPTRSSVDRRSFFRRLLLKGLDNLEEAGQRVANHPVLRSLDADRPRPTTQPGGRTNVLLRPPGAIDEPAFSQTCTGCAECVKACPAQCIRLDSADDPDARAEGRDRPYIIARLSPCVVCDDLSCMKVCPTGALRLVERVEDIDMGFAGVAFDRCLRGRSGGASGADEDCRLCITECPVGDDAIGLDQHGYVEVRAGCIGCGICERACPTEPASISIVPRKEPQMHDEDA